MAQGHEDVGELIARGSQARRHSDIELASEVLRKDRKATAEFVARYTNDVYAYVRRRLAPRMDLAEDMVQEIFLAAWESLDKFKADSSLRNWILGIARHKVEDHYRRRLRECQLSEESEALEEDALGLIDIEELLDQRQAGKRVREIVIGLPELYSVILQWKYWERRSLRDIAAQTGKTEKAVERLLARARDHFKKRWNERPPHTRR